MKILSWLPMILLLLLQCQTALSSLNTTTTIKKHLCREDQSQSLLELKQQLSPEDDYMNPSQDYKTASWNRSWDCCLWHGVSCDESGRVVGLDLSGGDHLSGNIDSNSTLFRLTHLRILNLANNDFDGSEISFKFGRLNHLTHLNLSSLGLGGQTPLQFYHLSNLVSLDLSWNPTLNCDIKLLFSNMTKLRVVVLGNLNITSQMPMNMSSFLTHLDLTESGLVGDLPTIIFEKPDLQIVRLGYNDGLTGSLPTLNRSKVRSIEELDLILTSISGNLPESIGFMNNLNFMRLSGCKFSGPIPESIGNMTEITRIDFSGNGFSHRVPSTISNLLRLTALDLSRNHLDSQLPNAFSNLQKLTSLSLSSNYLIGLIPSSLTNLSQLKELYISSNSLIGPFPSTEGDRLQKLTLIDLSQNLINGMIPSWLLNLPSLVRINLSSNRLTGPTGTINCKTSYSLDLSYNQLEIELVSFYNLTEIGSLSFSGNTITEHAHQTVNITLPNLAVLELSSCRIKEFPELLRNTPNLLILDLSHNQIHGPIPSWFSSIPWQGLGLSYLNLSNNFLSYAGDLTWQNLKYLQYLDLHSNSLRQTFPPSFCNMSQLSLLNLSNNKFRGRIPECIGNSSSQLWVLDLRRNQFDGNIPTTIGKSCSWLGNLGLNANHLKGPLPLSLANCSALEVLDLGNNLINDTFPWWLGTLPQLKILILKSNKFHDSIRPSSSNISFTNLQIVDLSFNNFTGILPEKLFTSLEAMKNQNQSATDDLYLGGYRYKYSVTLSVKGDNVELTKVLRVFTSIDLSSNGFHGSIPESMAELNSLRLLNLSRNNIGGSIPPALGHLTKLEQLDLSRNLLTGGIPYTLTNLTFLSVLNLSCNHLVGPIPQGNQFSTFSNDSYVGNSGLCGAPLTKTCGEDEVPPSPMAFEEEDDDSSLMMGFTWKAVVMGYGCGVVFGFVLGSVMVCIRKPKWLARFVYVEAAICLRRRRKRGRAVQGRR